MDHRLVEKAADLELVDRRYLYSWGWGQAELGQALEEG